MTKEVKINNKFKWGKEFVRSALDSISSWGETKLYSSGDAVIDEYLGNSRIGAYGRPQNYEIITIFGSTGMSKSTFASSMVIDPALKGTQIGYFALEDDPVDVVRRLYKPVCPSGSKGSQK